MIAKTLNKEKIRKTISNLKEEFDSLFDEKEQIDRRLSEVEDALVHWNYLLKEFEK